MFQVFLEVLYSNKLVMAVQIFLIVSSLIVGLMILALLVLALWKVCITWHFLNYDLMSYSHARLLGRLIGIKKIGIVHNISLKLDLKYLKIWLFFRDTTSHKGFNSMLGFTMVKVCGKGCRTYQSSAFLKNNNNKINLQ